MLTRRTALTGLAALFAPAVITRPGVLMPVKWQPDWDSFGVMVKRPGPWWFTTQHVYVSNHTNALAGLTASRPTLVRFEKEGTIRLRAGETAPSWVCSSLNDPNAQSANFAGLLYTS